MWFFWKQSSGPPTRKFDLTHLPGEWGLSWCWVGEVLLLQEHRGARDLLRTSPHFPPDSGAGSRPGGGLQEQESTCTFLLLFNLTLIRNGFSFMTSSKVFPSNKFVVSVAAALPLPPAAPAGDVETDANVAQYQPHLHLPEQRDHNLWWAERTSI